jgi:hypothetical protein
MLTILLHVNNLKFQETVNDVAISEELVLNNFMLSSYTFSHPTFFKDTPILRFWYPITV